jgi:uncharacterized repeat protein (TIGR03803 family)
MKKVLRGIVAATVFGAALFAPAASAAPTVTVSLVHTLTDADGYFVNNLVLDKAGNLYGSARQGGVGGEPAPGNVSSTQGTIFKLTPAGSLTVLYDFNDVLGVLGLKNNTGAVLALPSQLVAAPGGLIYFIAHTEVPLTYGTVLAFSPIAPELLLPLHVFANVHEAPSGVLIRGSDGSLYGATDDESGGGDGAIFQITAAAVTRNLYQFSGGGDGGNPQGLMQAANGVLYGTTDSGGASNNGTVFSLTTAGKLTTLHSFTYAEGVEASAPLVQGRDGDLYGTSRFGGANGYGTAFQITPTGVLTVIHDFGLNEAYPNGLILSRDGNLYGTTNQAGPTTIIDPEFGTLFEIAQDGTFSTLAGLGVTAAGLSEYALQLMVQSPDGSFYGISDTTNIVRVTVQQ